MKLKIFNASLKPSKESNTQALIDLVTDNMNSLGVAVDTVYLKDLENFSIVNSVMDRHLLEPYPARAAVEVSRLPKDVQVEIDAVLFKE